MEEKITFYGESLVELMELEMGRLAALTFNIVDDPAKWETKGVIMGGRDATEFAEDMGQPAYPKTDFEKGYEAGLHAQAIVRAEQAEPTPLKIDPATLSEDERAFYDQGYDACLEDCNDTDSGNADERATDAYNDGIDDGRIEAINDFQDALDDLRNE